MTQYRIKIEKVETKNVRKQSYEKKYESDVYKDLKRDDPDLEQYAYIPYDTTEEVLVSVYNQTIEKEPDMMAVIKAFNSDISK